MNNSNKDLKILVCVIHGPYEPWLTILREGQLETWMNPYPGVRIINVFGKPISKKLLKIDQLLYFKRWSPTKIIAYFSLLIEGLIKKILNLDQIRPQVNKSDTDEPISTWVIQMPDSLLLQGVKNITAFRASLDEDFDYLVTTISSSYLNIAAIWGFLAEQPTSNFLGGRIECSGKMRYQQGSFRVYSRDVVEYICQNSKRYKHWQIEDVAMGNLIRLRYENLTSMSSVSVSSIEEATKLTQDQFSSTMCYRCKSIDGVKRNDSEIMHYIHQRLQQIS